MDDFLRTQVEIERHAIRLVDRPDVVAAVTALAERWQAGTPGLLPETYAQLRPSLDEVVFLVALQVANGDPRRPRVVEISAGPHAWGGLDVPGGRWGINNPDTLYFAVPIEPGSSYVLTGRPNGAAPVDVNISVQTPDVGHTRHHRPQGDRIRGRRQLRDHRRRLGCGGRPRSPVDRRRRHGAAHPSDPCRLDPRAPLRPRRGAHRRPRTHSTALRRRPRRATDRAARRGDRPQPADVAAGDPLAAGEHDPAARRTGRPGGLLPTQRNTLGHFRLADDEALVLVLSPGGAGYAAVAAPNVWGVTADSARHPNSLNNRQAVVDADGRVTVVVANTDPGVTNWVDPGGLREGILMLRWQLLSQEPDVDGPPAVAVRQVRTADLPSVLPASVPRVGSTAERDDQLAARAAAYARRFQTR